MSLTDIKHGGEMMRIGIAADHGGFELKVQLTAALEQKEN